MEEPKPITITDNCFQGYILKGEELAHKENLSKLSALPIGELKIEDNPNLLVFPQSLNQYKDGITNEYIFTMRDHTIYTGNIMGFVGYKNTRLRIHSRFAKTDEQDFFLHYMLQRVFAVNLFDLNYTSDQTSIFDFLIYIFPAFLKRAYRQGLYKEYQTHHYNDTHLRGRIDMAQHIRKNIPFTGNIAYQTREYAYNNDVTQLVRHTIEYIRLHPYANGILQNDADTKEAVNAIAQATPTYNRQERLKVINRNLRPIRHPYYGEYRYLQQLCLQILRHEELKYGTTNDEIYGILFDGAWLWEEYLNTLLAPIGFLHPRNKDSQGAIWLFNSPKSAPRYPDFYRQDFILDAKYKGYTDKRVSEVDRDDLHQLITYMYIRQAAHGGLVYPSISSDTALSPAKLCGYGGTIFLWGMTIPQSASSWKEFKDQMLYNEKTLVKHIVE